ncbi:CHAT domain-containing protein [Corallococcus exercitus]|uniref:CHAT domain-containing protein n=1 Tax=Corallococcus exercitus TaxID=2316736 RepID=A0A7Y4KJF1_9BACT|nr:CHAT domain-containing protein [Corallococcus exercitus]NOK34752.1 CHAT domain-containing protein [Corallococcus exercitus]
MRTLRTITLELLRHGPPHNQLLSPLTPYMALCGSHGAQTLYLPFEHREFLLRLRGLRSMAHSSEVDEARRAYLREVGQRLSELLDGVPGLTAELGAWPRGAEGVVHLQLVTSAAELALLPFEAVLSPRGAPAAGLPLALQTDLPVSITRQVRRSTPPCVPWPSRPRILFVTAAPGGLKVPAEEHRNVLLEAIQPWVRPSDEAGKDNSDELLTVLENASLEALRKACAARDYTHVHLLAHGKPMPGLGGERFGIILHDEAVPDDERVVSGELLATALRGHTETVEGRLSHPAVVTVASCDSANQGSVVEPAGSIAHALHEAGIPFVVASQYPLTGRGSVAMTRGLYTQLLWGADPRVVLHSVRQQLQLLDEPVHDWASLVAYASFPADFDAQLRATQIRSAIDAVKASLRRSELKLRAGQSSEPLQQDLRRARQDLKQAQERLEYASPSGSDANARDDRAEIQGLCGSIDKQLAQFLDRSVPEDQRGPSHEECKALLFLARDHYWRGLMEKPSSHWHATQYLSLCVILNMEGKELRRQYNYACQVARFSLETARRDDERIWGLGSLAELKLLSALLPDCNQEKALSQARRYIQRLLKLAVPGSFAVNSTRRQIERYSTWWERWRPRLAGLARELLQEFPQDSEFSGPSVSPGPKPEAPSRELKP